MKARWSRLAALGLLMIAAGPALFLIAALVYGLDFGDETTFFVIFTAAPLLAALLVWRFGWWAKVVGIIAALLTAGAFFWTAFGFAQPGSFFDFVPGLLVVPGFLIALPSCIGAIVAARRDHAGAASGGEKLAIRTVLGLVLLLAAVSAVLTWIGRSTATDVEASDTVVTMKNNEFAPKDLSLGQGDSILLRNDDAFFHTFTLDALSIDEAATPGDEIAVRLPDEPGTYVFYCRPHTRDSKDPEEDDMAGTLTIE